MWDQEDQNYLEDRRKRDVRTFARNLEELAASIRPGQSVPGASSIDGTDGSGTVHCVVDRAGRLVHLGIDAAWWSAVGPAGIAAAIMDALRFAKYKAAMVRLILYRYGHRPARAVLDSGSVFTSEPTEPLPPPGSPGFQRAVERKLRRTSTILEEAERFSRARDSGKRRVITGPRGLFRLVLIGHELFAAEVDEHCLGPGDADALALDAGTALRAAARLTKPLTAHGGMDD